jgi:hypothetical protein
LFSNLLLVSGSLSVIDSWIHPVRGDMFIDREATSLRLRSEERNSSDLVNLSLNSAPPNGDSYGGGLSGL